MPKETSGGEADALVRYLGRRVKEAYDAGASLKDMAPKVKLSSARLSTLKDGKGGGMRLEKAEALAAYFGLGLRTALDAAIGQPRAENGAPDKYTHRPLALRILSEHAAVRPAVLQQLRTFDPYGIDDPTLVQWFEIAASLERSTPREATGEREAAPERRKARSR